MDQETIFHALGAYADAVVDGQPVSATVSAGGTQPVYTTAGEQGDPIAVKRIQRYVVTIIPHASIPPGAINDVRNREADRLRDAIEHDPTLGGRLPRPTGFVRVERTAHVVGVVGVSYLIDPD